MIASGEENDPHFCMVSTRVYKYKMKIMVDLKHQKEH
jgi:hypothetical protein